MFIAKSWTRALCLAFALAGALAAPAVVHSQVVPTGEVGIDDYLQLLAQISPAARDGAQVYVEAFKSRCGRALRPIELRQAVAVGDGDPVLMGMIRAVHLQDQRMLDQMRVNMRCPGR